MEALYDVQRRSAVMLLRTLAEALDDARRT